MPSLQEELEEGKAAYWEALAEQYKAALGAMASSEETPPAALVSAAKEVFDRAYGKVADKVELSGDVKLLLDIHRITGTPSPQTLEEGPEPARLPEGRA